MAAGDGTLIDAGQRVKCEKWGDRSQGDGTS
jgi:hypothetical protein